MDGLTYGEDIRWTEPSTGHRGAFRRGWHDAQDGDPQAAHSVAAGVPGLAFAASRLWSRRRPSTPAGVS